jgi:uncharacterized protein YgbK (DUF1537 family)
VISPAFPDLGRVVRNGCLCVEDDPKWKALPVAPLLDTQGLQGCSHVKAVAFREAIGRGERIISIEATSNEDLDNAAAEALHSGLRVLWAGSAGLAAALARAVLGDKGIPRWFERKNGPVLFCIGSDHPVTMVQTAELAKQRKTSNIGIGTLRSGAHGIFTISRNGTTPEDIRKLLLAAREMASAIFVSGGDTASLVCRAFETDYIELRGEVVPGLPWGVLKGGLLDGFPVAMKSGGFGGPDALVRVADFFTCN